ncbi:hypothetical protein [Leptolyngbya sp. Heron Island J]|uniref:hypothetical protein n=1 Tax=Leptolyngbya sp. Heron Island J TaxID=1385935 RepID=UPI001267A29C|nr:hypothetical protein [Leptolyngbya sp. Heron Island J]
MQLHAVYSLWSLKPCLEFLVVLFRTFRNPASGHRPSRSQLKTAIQDLIDRYFHVPLRLMEFGFNRLMPVLPKHNARFWQLYSLPDNEAEQELSLKYIFFS